MIRCQGGAYLKEQQTPAFGVRAACSSPNSVDVVASVVWGIELDYKVDKRDLCSVSYASHNEILSTLHLNHAQQHPCRSGFRARRC